MCVDGLGYVYVYEIVYYENMIKNKWQKNDNNQNKVNMIMLIRRLQNSNIN